MRWIYLLRDPRDGRPRYVGCCHDPDARLRRHLTDARAGDRCPKARWLRRLIKLGLEPELDAVERVGRKVDHAGRERQWIEHLIASGEKLLNVQNGGNVRRAANLRRSASARALQRLREADVVGRAAAEFGGDRSNSCPLHGPICDCPVVAAAAARRGAADTPTPDVPAAPQLNRFGHYQDAAGRWRTPRGAKPRGRVPVQKPLR